MLINDGIDMNILFITYNYPPKDGGIAQFNYHLCKEFNRNGHRLRVLTDYFKDCENFDKENPFQTIRLKFHYRPTALNMFLNVIRVSRKYKPDVIFFGHFGSTHWLAVILIKKFYNVPYVILAHGTEFSAYFHGFSPVDSWASRIVLKNADGLIANSHVTKKLVESHGYLSDKVHVVHPGVDIDKFRPETRYSPRPYTSSMSNGI